MGCIDRPPDRFARFLASLSRHLDDRHLRGGDLAAEPFVSRSLLDKLVRAAAGGPPDRFRRRLLLERAAYQQRTCGVSIIDAATQAGYSSREAFTRAFQRSEDTPQWIAQTRPETAAALIRNVSGMWPSRTPLAPNG